MGSNPTLSARRMSTDIPPPARTNKGRAGVVSGLVVGLLSINVLRHTFDTLLRFGYDGCRQIVILAADWASAGPFEG